MAVRCWLWTLGRVESGGREDERKDEEGSSKIENLEPTECRVKVREGIMQH